MNGYLKIKTKLDNSEIDKDVEQLESKIKKLQEDNSNASIEQNSLQKEIDSYDQLTENAQKYKKELERINDEKAKVQSSLEMLNSPDANTNKKTELVKGNVYSTDIRTGLNQYQTANQLNELNNEAERLQTKYQVANNELNKQAPKIDKIYVKLTKVKAKQSENNTKILEYKRRIDSIKLNKIQSGLDNVGKKMQNSISKLGRMAMAVFGIRTAFSAVRQAINAVSQYNPKIAADFEYMRYCIANLLTPAIQGLVKLLYTVLSYINAIASAWFGINLFGNASVKNFQKMQKSIGGSAKSAKEIQKSLQGFDEMNILQDNSSNSGGGASSPSMDLSGIQGNVPQWLKWIMDNRDLMLQIIAGVVAGIIALKLGLTSIQALGIGIAVAGIVSLIQNIITFIQDPSWENFSNILLSISMILAGIALAIGGTFGTAIASIAAIIAGIAIIIQGVMNYLNDPTWENFINILGGIMLVVGAVLLLIGGIPALITGIILLVAAIGLAIYKHWDEVCQLLGQVGQWIYDNVIMPVWNFIQGCIDWIVAGMKFLLSVFEGICTALTGVLLAPFETLWEMVNGVFNGIKQILQGIANVFRGIFSGDIRTVLLGFKQIFKGIFDSLWAIAKAPLNLIIRGINSLIRGANRIKFDVPDWVPGIGGKQFGFHISEIPLLAKGGVISQPTTAVIGEAGREAVVPLENNLEWLDILATKIANKIDAGSGSYIINMDSRTIQRGIARRQQELAFAKNGR